MAGAKGKYTEERVAAICEAIRLGVPFRHAAAKAGITEETFYVWMREKPQFSERIKSAESDGIEDRLKLIRAAANEQWQAAAWLLERRFPHDFGRTVQEHQGEQKLTIEYVNDWRGGGSHADGA